MPIWTHTIRALILLWITSLFAPLKADEHLGAYLAGRQAFIENDFDASTRYLIKALVADPSNTELIDNILSAKISLGQIKSADTFVDTVNAFGTKSQLGNMVRIANLIVDEKYDQVISQINSEQGINPILDQLILAWCLAATGELHEGLNILSEMGNEKSFEVFSLMQKALLLAAFSETERAFDALETLSSGLGGWSEQAKTLQIQLMLQTGEVVQAQQEYDQFFSDRNLDPSVGRLQNQILNYRSSSSLASDLTLEAGLSQAFYSIAQIIDDDTDPQLVLLYIRLAQHVRSDRDDAALFAANILERLGQHDLAIREYKKIHKTSSYYLSAELGRADAMMASDNVEGALDVIRDLTIEFPVMALTHSTLGDIFRRQEQFDQAILAYDRAIMLMSKDDPQLWYTLYTRGIAHERLKIWPKAEADFRASLQLVPDQPNVLNYLGYSLIDRGEKLEEAMEMIERAVKERPDSGFIVDSLAWGLFKLGRYQEALPHMERASILMPVDPIVTDHLGDIYWAVDRKLEARFQWRRALSFAPEPKEATRIRLKLEVGLDKVLIDEGANPTHAVSKNDD